MVLLVLCHIADTALHLESERWIPGHLMQGVRVKRPELSTLVQTILRRDLPAEAGDQLLL